MDVRAILKISGGEAGFATTSGGVAPIPGITLGVITRLVLDMRAEGGQDDVELPSIPAGDLAGCDSYYIAIDNDWSQGTAPKMTRTSGISVVEEGGRTLFQAELPNTAAIPGLAAAIETAAAKSITLHCEIGGTKAGVGDVFAYNFSLVIRNRVWLPDGSPEDLPSDPDYLNTAQVTALINATVAEAIEGITGDPGPAPTITVGTVTSGATASATLTPGAEPGEYTLDLVLPQGAPGDEGEMPALAVGTVTEGDAAAEIVAGEGGYTLNLTVPRGLPGAGVTPSGIWAVGTTYALNDAVRYNGGWWRSLQAGNTGHTPPVGTEGDAWWEVIVKDGIDAEPFLRVYNDTDDADDPDWHAEFQPGDTHFRDSVDGGATWTAPVLISIAHDVIVLFNIDATTDWTALTPGATYSTGTGKYMRARQAGGAWGTAYQIHELESQALRVQFSAGGASPTWHATLQPGDTQARFYNTLATIDVTVTISDGSFDVAEIQICPIANPWHATYAEGDDWMKISTDGGEEYGSAIPLRGEKGEPADPEESALSLMAFTRLRLIRPSAVLPAHLVIEASADRDFASISTVIDTAAVAADRNRVLAWDGAEFVPMPAAGFGFGHVGALVLVDMSQLAAPSYIRYRWDYEGSDTTAYRYTYFPSCGEAGTIDGGGAAVTTGSLQFNLLGDLSGEGRWSIDEGATWRTSGEIVTGLPPWTFAVTFKAVTGYTKPTDTTATVVAGELTTATATYVAEVGTGSYAYLLSGSEPTLLTDQADPTKCFGPPDGYGYYIINGKLYAYDGGLIQIGTATDWTAVAGHYLLGRGAGWAIRGAGKLYAISGTNISQVGTAEDWTEVTMHYALKGIGDTLYYLYGTTATEVSSGMSLPRVSHVRYGYAISNDGKLYKLDGATATQVGVATNWTSVSGGYHSVLVAYATNSSGELYAIEDTTATQVVPATDWGSIAGISDATHPAYGQRGDNGDLYTIVGTTATLLSEGWGLGTLTAYYGEGYYITPGGGLFRLSGTSAPAQIGSDEDWTYISSSGYLPLAVRGSL